MLRAVTLLWLISNALAFGQGITATGNATASGTQTVFQTQVASAPPPLAFTTVCPLPTANQNQTYATNLNATGGLAPYAFSIASGTLPTGLSLAASGAISGTPSGTGTSVVNYLVTDSSTPVPQTAQLNSCSITVSPAPPPPLSVNTSPPPPAGFTGVAYSYTFSATGGTPPYTNWAIISGNLPNGLSLNPSTGAVSGTPTTAQTSSFTAQVMDSIGATANAPFSITINQVTPSGGTADEPHLWADPHEVDSSIASPAVTRYWGATSTGCPTNTGSVCNYVGGNFTTWQNIENDYCADLDRDWKVVVTHQLLVSGHGPVNLCAKTGATHFISYISDSPNPSKVTVCSGGINDSNQVGLDPGSRNYQCANGTWLSHMWTAECTGYSGSKGCVISANAVDGNGKGPHHHAFFDAEIRPNTSIGTAIQVFMIDQGAALNSAASNGEAEHMWYFRNYWHGTIPDNPVFPNPGTYINISNFIRMECKFCGIMDSYMDQIGCSQGCESHIILSVSAHGPERIEHNWVEGSSVPLFQGGGLPAIAGTVTSDVEIRRNRFTRSTTWISATPCSTGNFLDVKGIVELKEGQRILLDGNIFENNCGGGQEGQTMTLTPRVGSGPSNFDGYTERLDDILVSNSIMRHSATFVQTDSTSGGVGNGNGVGNPGRRWTFIDILGYDLGTVYGTTTAYFFKNVQSRHSWTGCIATRNAAGTSSTIDCTASPSTATGQLQTDILPGDAVWVNTCASGGPNPDPSPTSFQVGNGSLGPAATSVTNLTVTYPNPGAASKTASCTLVDPQGFVDGLSARHITLVAVPQSIKGAGNWTAPSYASTGNISFNKNTTYQDDIFAVNGSYGGWGDSLSAPGHEGTITENYQDTATLVGNHLLFSMSRPLSQYTEYGGPNSGAKPPVTIWSPANISCAGASADSTCFGFTNMRSGAAFNVADSDYHGYALHSSSLYKAGGSRQASDGTDMGARIPNIDNALTRPQYVCTNSSKCTQNGTVHGPYVY